MEQNKKGAAYGDCDVDRSHSREGAVCILSYAAKVRTDGGGHANTNLHVVSTAGLEVPLIACELWRTGFFTSCHFEWVVFILSLRQYEGS